MEPFTTAALGAALTALVNGAAGEAGKTSWNKLKSFVAARLGRHSDSAGLVTVLEARPADESAAERLAIALRAAVDDDPPSLDWLRSWLGEAQAALPATNVVNTVTGNAQVHGPTIQGHTFHGDIHFS